MNTKFGWQFLGKPPENYRALCGGSNGIKIVGNEADLNQLNEWTVEIKQARLITAEPRIQNARNTVPLKDIPALAASLADEYAAVATRLGGFGWWWEVPYIMPEVSDWTCAWYPAAAEAFKSRGLMSVVWGFATGTPQVAPWATASSPDEWPKMYGGLAKLSALEPRWVRIGVEEYITGGRLIPDDYSNLGRIKEVYNRHIAPHGWNIVFRGIETGYDVPGMWDAGITPHNVLTGRDGGNGSGGLEAADVRYNAMPFVDCMFLYQVSDPVSVPNEAKFAFTPGNKNGPGYLEKMRDYFIANPPKPFVVPGPITPVPEPPPPPPPPSTVTLYDMAFNGYNHVFDIGDTFGDRWIPTDNNGSPQFYYRWITPADGKKMHAEPYPPENTGFSAPYALRLQNQSAVKQEFWLWADFETVPGDTIKVTLESAPEVVGGSGTVTRAIVIDPGGDNSATVPGLPYADTTAPTKAGITLTAVATGPLTTVMALVKWKIPLRVNVDIARFKVERTRGTTPPPTPTPDPGQPSPGVYVTTGAVNIRPQPNTTTARVGEFLAGKDVPIVEFVRGEVYNGNPYWGKIATGLFVSAYFLRSK